LFKYNAITNKVSGGFFVKKNIIEYLNSSLEKDCSKISKIVKHAILCHWAQ